MSFKKLIVLGTVALSVTACATTSAPDDLGDLVHTGFSEKSDGTAYHKVMGVSCPAEIGGMIRTSTKVYNDKGTDISCNYGGGGRVFTMYLSQFPKYDLPSIYRGATAAIENGFVEQGYRYDEELSEICSSQSIDSSSILSGLAGFMSGDKQDNTMTLSPAPSAVYTLDSDMTLVVVDEMFDHEFFKVRFTGPFDGEPSVKSTCELIRNTYLSTKTFVEEDRGIEVSKKERLRQLINSSNGS